MYPIICSLNGIYVNYYLNKVTVMIFAFSESVTKIRLT